MLGILKNILTNMVVFAIILLAGLGISFYVLLGQETKKLFVDQISVRQQGTVRAGSAAISAFFDLAGRSLTIMAQDPHVIDRGPKTQSSLERMVDRWKGTPFIGVILTDEKGVVRIGANQERAPFDLVSVADREYFQWAKTAPAGSYKVFHAVISKTGQTKGKYIVNIATPVVDDTGTFRGVLSNAVLLSSLADQYVAPLRVSSRTSIYIVQKDGTFLYAPEADFIGQSIFPFMEKNPLFGSLIQRSKDILDRKEAGTMRVAIPEFELVSWNPVAVDDTWYLVVAMPESEALNALAPLYLRAVGVLAVMFLILLAYGIRLARYYSFKEAQAVEHQKHGL